MFVRDKICFITNIGPHYRYCIYNTMGKVFGCDFYLGDKVALPIKKFDYSLLTGFKKILVNKFFHSFYWQKGAVWLAFKNYDCYIMTGEPYCISSWIILVLSKLLGKKTIAWTHGWYGRESKVKKIVKRVYFSLYSNLLVYSDYAINLMGNEGLNKARMYCIANSLDSDNNKRIRSTLKKNDIYSVYFQNNAPTIIYCGRIQKCKNLELLVDSVCLLKNEGIIVNIIFIGKDVENVNIDRYAQIKGLGKQIWMYGPCYDNNILGELFYNASVCVSPGNVGLTAIQALSFGCPVISHDNFKEQCPEFEAIKPGKTGDFFKYNNVYDLAEKIREWTSLSAQIRQRISRAAYEEIDKKWNIHYQIAVLKKVIK